MHTYPVSLSNKIRAGFENTFSVAVVETVMDSLERNKNALFADLTVVVVDDFDIIILFRLFYFFNGCAPIFIKIFNLI